MKRRSFLGLVNGTAFAGHLYREYVSRLEVASDTNHPRQSDADVVTDNNDLQLKKLCNLKQDSQDNVFFARDKFPLPISLCAKRSSIQGCVGFVKDSIASFPNLIGVRYEAFKVV